MRAASSIFFFPHTINRIKFKDDSTIKLHNHCNNLYARRSRRLHRRHCVIYNNKYIRCLAIIRPIKTTAMETASHRAISLATTCITYLSAVVALHHRIVCSRAACDIPTCWYIYIIIYNCHYQLHTVVAITMSIGNHISLQSFRPKHHMLFPPIES